MVKHSEIEKGLNQKRKDILNAALKIVVFEGWSERALMDSGHSLGMSVSQILFAFPEKEMDLALYFHSEGDKEFNHIMKETNFSEMRYREKVALAVRTRLAIASDNKEAVRRASAFFAMPMNIPSGASAIWRTVDSIWVALGDISQDSNWYTKRITLYLIYSSSLLFWLGDSSDGDLETAAFIDRQIDNLMKLQSKSQIFSSFFNFALPVAENIFSKNIVTEQKSSNLPGKCFLD